MQSQVTVGTNNIGKARSLYDNVLGKLGQAVTQLTQAPANALPRQSLT
ncbi:hypothetical protein PMI29_00715 [Pseudomonas sp. GM49]|nr:hypothetical protein [Pseudomonas sp. GM49]EJM73909.1 hypothetical protein PMI29_00715 [Pseudomonas sp. GM49]